MRSPLTHRMAENPPSRFPTFLTDLSKAVIDELSNLTVREIYQAIYIIVQSRMDQRSPGEILDTFSDHSLNASTPSRYQTLGLQLVTAALGPQAARVVFGCIGACRLEALRRAAFARVFTAGCRELEGGQKTKSAAWDEELLLSSPSAVRSVRFSWLGRMGGMWTFKTYIYIYLSFLITKLRRNHPRPAACILQDTS
ncbi:hypothetical protein K439DRAFT_319157 [Ramaria rubella]|nr:hypothetical protein K439DRAFT_319157 [Ramaria rubella]